MCMLACSLCPKEQILQFHFTRSDKVFKQFVMILMCIQGKLFSVLKVWSFKGFEQWGQFVYLLDSLGWIFKIALLSYTSKEYDLTLIFSI